MSTVTEPINPMRAVRDIPPVGDDWAYEFKYNGIRGIARTGRTGPNGPLRVTSKSGKPITDTYPELGALVGLLGERSVVLDGEIVALAGGVPSFHLLQHRMQATPTVPRLALIPVCYYVFDVLGLDGQSVEQEPYWRRRQLLDELHLDIGSGPVRVPPSITGMHPLVVLASAAEFRLEGMVSKKLTSRYQRGPRRSRSWVKTRLDGPEGIAARRQRP